MQTVEIADAAAFERTLRRLAHQILENNPEPEQVLLVGILRRGVPLAEELAGLMERFGGVRPPVEMLDITLYRGHRELPIDPEYVGKNVPTAREEQICVLTPQFDGQWGIHLRKQA